MAAARGAAIFGGGALCGAHYSNPELGAILKAWLPGAVDWLKQPAAVVAKADDIQTAALASSMAAIQVMLQQQRAPSSSSALRTALMVAAPVAAAGLALRYYGWTNVGWATPRELKERLAALREALVGKVKELSDTMQQRFGIVDAKLDETRRCMDQVKTDLSGEIQAVGSSVSSLDARIAPMEHDMRRAAKGVDLLCEVVSGLPGNAPELRRRLDDFTGAEHAAVASVAPPAVLMPPSSAAAVAPSEPSPFFKELFKQPLRSAVPTQ